MAASDATADEGRVARSMRRRRERIFRAAAELFAERGFDQTTTQEISDRADVAAGTLFRYAATKGALLLMVYNQQFTEAIEHGERLAEQEKDPVEAVLALVLPMISAAASNGRTSAVYQRELLFGSPQDTYRAQGLELVARLEGLIADRLVREADALGAPSLRESALQAGRSVFAVTHMTIARPSTGAFADRDAIADLRSQVRMIVHGYLAEAAAHKEQS